MREIGRSWVTGLLAGGVIAFGAIAADFTGQTPVAGALTRVAPGVFGTADPDVFVLSNARENSLARGRVDGAGCPDLNLRRWTGTTSTLCPCFAVGEEAGVTFEAPLNHYPLDVVQVIIAWAPAPGAECDQTTPELQGAIKFYRGGLPNPGFEQLVIADPGLTCGFFNVFDLPLLGVSPFRVNSGRFTVTLEFDPAVNQLPYGRSIVSDGNGCQAGTNVVFMRSPFFGWFDACQLGVTGDWKYEVVYRRVSCDCPGDTNGDRQVNFTDLNIVLSQYGQTAPSLMGDVNDDGTVNFEDLNIVLSRFGTIC